MLLLDKCAISDARIAHLAGENCMKHRQRRPMPFYTLQESMLPLSPQSAVLAASSAVCKCRLLLGVAAGCTESHSVHPAGNTLLHWLS